MVLPLDAEDRVANACANRGSSVLKRVSPAEIERPTTCEMDEVELATNANTDRPPEFERSPKREDDWLADDEHPQASSTEQRVVKLS